MIRHFGVVCALALGIASSVTPLLAGDRALPMRFQLRQDAAQDCADNCRLLISAAGAITADTPSEFRNLPRAATFKAPRWCSTPTAARCSARSRLAGISATSSSTPRSASSPTRRRSKSGVMRANLSPRADCESMCAFVLLAGMQRAVAPEARVMVHQIWLGDRRDDPTAATYSAEDLVLVQRDIGRLAKYTADMGGPADLLEARAAHSAVGADARAHARRTRSRWVSSRNENAPRDAPTRRRSPSVSYAPTTAGNRSGGPEEQGWAMVERAGASMLARRHPLTIEGDEIGSFDLVLACGSD